MCVGGNTARLREGLVSSIKMDVACVGGNETETDEGVAFVEDVPIRKPMRLSRFDRAGLWKNRHRLDIRNSLLLLRRLW